MDIDIIGQDKKVVANITEQFSSEINELQKLAIDKKLEQVYNDKDKKLVGYKLDKFYNSEYMLVLNNYYFAYFEDIQDLRIFALMMDKLA